MPSIKPGPRRSPIPLFACTALLFGGCASYTTLQTARTLAPGKVQFGAGTAIIPSEGGIGVLPEFGGRLGVVHRFDIGAKYVLPSLVFADAKVQVLDARNEVPIDLALDMGASHSSFESDDGDGSISCSGLYPAILFGEESWYAGAKATFLFFDGSIKTWSGDEISVDRSGYISTDFVAGLVLGRRLQFLPELNLHVDRDGHLLPVPAMSFVYNVP